MMVRDRHRPRAAWEETLTMSEFLPKRSRCRRGFAWVFFASGRGVGGGLLGFSSQVVAVSAGACLDFFASGRGVGGGCLDFFASGRGVGELAAARQRPA